MKHATVGIKRQFGMRYCLSPLVEIGNASE